MVLKKVMIVEDESEILDIYKDRLSSFPEVEFEFFNCSRTAIEHYRGSLQEYSLLIVDLHMPEKSGESFIFDVKYLNPDQNIVVLSADPYFLKVPVNFNVTVYQKPYPIEDVISVAMSQ